MEILSSAEEMRAWSSKQKRDGKTIALVPTMGALHDGHISLLNEGKRRADRLVLSIYVNPAQFGPNEDFSKYPRDTECDLEKAKKIKTDAVFLPSDQAMYPDHYQTYVTVENITKNLCGAARPGHFKGVATIVTKLFNIVTPHTAIFGEKDFQQLVMIKKMVRDLNMPVEIIGMPIVREADGLAMSSRNRCLSKEERLSALSIPRALLTADEMVKNEVRDAETIVNAARKLMEKEGLRIDYIKICDPDTLNDIASFSPPALIAIAAYAGNTRLIDNCLLK